MPDSIITFFPVGDKNGGMTLIRLNDSYETTILIDVCIGSEPIADHCDVAQELRDRLPRDSEGRPYVDAFVLTHRHQDHLQGIQTYFHLGKPEDYPEPNGDDEGKVFIRELWSSHNFWKPESKNYELCDDAKAFNKEMDRRVSLFEEKQEIQGEGDLAIVIGKDPDGRTDNLEDINYDIGDTFTKINNKYISSKISGLILSPIEQQENEEDECFTDKNRQSIVINLTVKQGDYSNKILLAADAECLVWETLWNDRSASELEYDILVAPHHCSWHSLSYDSQSEDNDPKISPDAKNALSQAKIGACIVSQSKAIKSNDEDPPSKAAKDEYLTVVSKDRFYCTNEYPTEEKPEPLEFNLTSGGPQKKSPKEKSKLSVAAIASTRESYPHG
ncbi:MAG: hypothetical protein J7L73_06375 [Anaerolineales bacterium]|nr:hypothetical protein [Anaerolineales bacterium]